MRRRIALAGAAFVVPFFACRSATAPGQTAQPAPAAAVDLTRLPVGDGHISSQPQRGAVWSCTSQFPGGGPSETGPWVRSDGTFDFTAKPTVDGHVEWPHQFTISLVGDRRIVQGNDLPDHPTGIFPIAPGDDAYQYDRNPNHIAAQTLRLDLPADPTPAAHASCVPLGPIGVLLTGGYFFNSLDAAGHDAVAHEIQDDCQGHPQQNGAYHYHSLSTCLEEADTGHSALVGYALDGFGIYGHRGEHGDTLTNADLDECHGHTHAIEWDGKQVVMYHYHATWEYPYTVGCFRGTPVPR